MRWICMMAASVFLACGTCFADQPVTARVIFRLTSMNLHNQADGQTVQSGAVPAEHPASTVQRGQFLKFTLNGGQAPYFVFSDNATIKPERLSDIEWKLVPQNIGACTVTIVDSRGGFTTQPINVIEDRYGEVVTIHDSSNGGGVSNGPSAPTVFTATTGFRLTYMRTYHHNNGAGANAGQIGLKHEDGRVFGPWMAKRDGNFWVIRPNAPIPPGRLTVVDSEPSTWSWNAQSGGGFVTVSGQRRLPNP